MQLSLNFEVFVEAQVATLMTTFGISVTLASLRDTQTNKANTRCQSFT